MDFIQQKKLEMQRFEALKRKKIPWIVFSILFCLVYFFAIVASLYAEASLWYLLFVIPATTTVFSSFDLIDPDEQWLPLWLHRANCVLGGVVAAVSIALALHLINV